MDTQAVCMIYANAGILIITQYLVIVKESIVALAYTRTLLMDLRIICGRIMI
jgi:hypothetical protein